MNSLLRARVEVVVVVSAMSGVTNKLIEAATQSEAGTLESVGSIFRELRNKHNIVISALIHSAAELDRIAHTMDVSRR